MNRVLILRFSELGFGWMLRCSMGCFRQELGLIPDLTTIGIRFRLNLEKLQFQSCLGFRQPPAGFGVMDVWPVAVRSVRPDKLE